jgi:ABC-type branched-subunit amino acid transport system ATPase component
MKNCLLKIYNIEKSFEGIDALQGFGCQLGKGEIVGLIGPNGAGKTTLFNVVTGFLQADSGNIEYKGKSINKQQPYQISLAGISRTFQNIKLIRQISVLDNVLLAFHNQPGENLFNVLFRWGLCKRVEAQNMIKAMELLDYVNLQDKALHPAEALSYGQQKLLNIACCLASDADLLLLDEPLAGIAPEMIEKILAIIKDITKSGKSVFFIEHNIDAVMQVCDRVIFMDEGKVISEGKPEEVRNDPNVIKACLD